ncbi:unnamed protein product, partial [Notodromas monacha]
MSKSQTEYSSGDSETSVKICLAPLSTDPVAIQKRQECCNSNEFITVDAAKSGHVKREIRVMADGVYDLLHMGHILMLKQAKEAFPNVYLIAGG